MDKAEPRHWAAISNLAAVCCAAVALLLIFAPGWSAPAHEQNLKGLMAVSGLVILYFDWRRGLLSGTLAELHQKVRARGSAAFGCLRPLPMLALTLMLIAGAVTALRG